MKFQTSDPLQLQQFLEPSTGSASFHALARSRFYAKVDMTYFGNLGLFWVQSDQLRVIKEPPHEFYSLTIPLGTPFSIRTNGNREIYGIREAYMMQQEEIFHFQSDSKCKVLVLNVFDKDFQKKKCKLIAYDNDEQTYSRNKINLLEPDMSLLLRALANSIAVLKDTNHDVRQSKIIMQEQADQLITHFVIATHQDKIEHATSKHKPSRTRLVRVEEYLAAHVNTPIERWKLAEIADTSITSLTRWFSYYYGMGPMTFLRQRRLDMTYLCLLGSQQGEVSVTDLALNYGFSHLGRFAVEYSKTFGESPSTTLQH